jgi:hypothetical protein
LIPEWRFFTSSESKFSLDYVHGVATFKHEGQPR